MTGNDTASPVFRRVKETRAEKLPAVVHSGWLKAFPWLIQGTTTRGHLDKPFDFGLFTFASPEATVRRHWRQLLRATTAGHAFHAHQVHGAEVRVHGRGAAGGDGLYLVDPCDGHGTRQPGTLLAVSIADCVPVFLVDARNRAVAVLHAGWRGTAAGVLEGGLVTMTRSFGSETQDVYVHLGPSICGTCYEVGAEVFEALDQPVPEHASPIDLREVLARRATVSGVSVDRISMSEHCTQCTNSRLFSHRAGDRCRQVGYLGIRG